MPDYTVRIAPLSNIPSILSSLGCTPQPVLESAGFIVGDFETGENQVPYTEAAGLIANSAKYSNCDSVGLALGQGFSLQQLGLVGQLAHTSKDAGSALRDLIDNFYLHDSGGVITLDRQPSRTSLGYMSIVPKRVSVTQVNDMCIACLCRVMRGLCGPDWHPARVELSRPRPASNTHFSDFFRAPIVFGAKNNALYFSSRWLDFPLSSSDRENHQVMAEIAGDLLSTVSPGLTTVVSSLLHQGLSNGLGTSNEVADAIGVHERTLRRRLRQENTSFRSLLDEVRQTKSLYYLSETQLSIGNIAVLLGYGSNHAFDHAFQRWYGTSPLQWRQLNSLCLAN